MSFKVFTNGKDKIFLYEPTGDQQIIIVYNNNKPLRATYDNGCIVCAKLCVSIVNGSNLQLLNIDATEVYNEPAPKLLLAQLSEINDKHEREFNDLINDIQY